MEGEQPEQVLRGLEAGQHLCREFREEVHRRMLRCEEIQSLLEAPSQRELREGSRFRSYLQEFERMEWSFAAYLTVGCSCQCRHAHLNPNTPGTLAARRQAQEIFLLSLFRIPRYDRLCRDEFQPYFRQWVNFWFKKEYLYRKKGIQIWKYTTCPCLAILMCFIIVRVWRKWLVRKRKNFATQQ